MAYRVEASIHLSFPLVYCCTAVTTQTGIYDIAVVRVKVGMRTEMGAGDWKIGLPAAVLPSKTWHSKWPLCSSCDSTSPGDTFEYNR